MTKIIVIRILNQDCNSDHPQNLMDWPLARDTSLVKVSCKSVQSDRNPDHPQNLSVPLCKSVHYLLNNPTDQKTNKPTLLKHSHPGEGDDLILLGHYVYFPFFRSEKKSRV